MQLVDRTESMRVPGHEHSYLEAQSGTQEYYFERSWERDADLSGGIKSKVQNPSNV